jgi:hypothetical protein
MRGVDRPGRLVVNMARLPGGFPRGRPATLFCPRTEGADPRTGGARPTHEAADPGRHEAADPRTLGGVTDPPICSAKGCRRPAIWALRWNNPKLHTPQRRKVWLACDEHRATLGGFLGARGFLRGVLPLSDPGALQDVGAPGDVTVEEPGDVGPRRSR